MSNTGATKVLGRAALALAEGVFSHTVDMTLWFIVYLGEMSIPQSASGQLWRAQLAADKFIEQINYTVIKNALSVAKKQGWISRSHRKAFPEITAEGKRRLTSVIPYYDPKRIWDQRLHLVTYDVPESQKHDREKLRLFVRRIGCGKLQDSVWITPYNSIDTLRTFIQEKNLTGTVIISDLGQDASIGDEDIRALLVRIYGLEAMNERYVEWMDDVDSGFIDHAALLKYFSILRDDPQLPFSLLPSWWKGDEAYERVKPLLLKLSFHLL